MSNLSTEEKGKFVLSGQVGSAVRPFASLRIPEQEWYRSLVSEFMYCNQLTPRIYCLDTLDLNTTRDIDLGLLKNSSDSSTSLVIRAKIVRGQLESTIRHQILTANSEGLEQIAAAKSVRMFEDIYAGANNCGILAALTWQERFDHRRGISVIEDSFIARRQEAGPLNLGGILGLQVYENWLNFVREQYPDGTIIKLIVANPQIEDLLCKTFSLAQNIRDNFYPEAAASASAQRLYCFTLGASGKVVDGVIERWSQGTS